MTHRSTPVKLLSQEKDTTCHAVKLYMYHHKWDILSINEAEVNLTTGWGVFNSPQATVNEYNNNNS